MRTRSMIPFAVLRWKVMTESPTTSGSCSARGCAREAQGRRGPAGVDDDHAPIPDNIEQILQVEDTNGLTKTRARAGGTAGHDPRLWSGGIARSPRARD